MTEFGIRKACRCCLGQRVLLLIVPQKEASGYQWMLRVHDDSYIYIYTYIYIHIYIQIIYIYNMTHNYAMHYNYALFLIG